MDNIFSGTSGRVGEPEEIFGQIRELLVILPLCNLWMFLQTPRFIAAMHDGLFYLHINTSMINSSFHH